MNIHENMLSIDDYPNKNYLKGVVYEWYCYNHLVNTYKSINIVSAKYNNINSVNKNYFSYNTRGNIIYIIGNTVISEFDAIGISNNQIYLWEITRSNSEYFHNKLLRKQNLMKIIFPNYKTNICFIIPKYRQCYDRYDRIIIPEPNYEQYLYEQYLNDGKFQFTDRISRCIQLNDFIRYSNNNSLICEVIFASEKYFNLRKKPQTNSYSDLIKKLYNLNNIQSEEFECYDINDKKVKMIKFQNNSYFIDNKIMGIIEFEIINEIKKLLRMGNFA